MVEIAYGLQFRFEVTVMTCLVGCFYVYEDKVLSCQCFYCRLCFPLLVGVCKSGCSFHIYYVKPGIPSNAPYKVNGTDCATAFNVMVHL